MVVSELVCSLSSGGSPYVVRSRIYVQTTYVLPSVRRDVQHYVTSSSSSQFVPSTDISEMLNGLLGTEISMFRSYQKRAWKLRQRYALQASTYVFGRQKQGTVVFVPDRTNASRKSASRESNPIASPTPLVASSKNDNEVYQSCRTCRCGSFGRWFHYQFKPETICPQECCLCFVVCR